MKKNDFLGFGLGLRKEHYQDVIETKPAVDWFEILTENYLVPGGKPLYYLDQVSKNYPLVMHGVSMSLGSTDPLNWDYLKQVKDLANRIDAKWVSDHLCWTGLQPQNMHDLLPLPYTEEALKLLTEKIKQVQDYLDRPFLVENVSSYLTYAQSVMTEWDFLAELTKRTGCYLLLDINNIYVSAFNHRFKAEEFLNAIPLNCVKQFHLAGHTNNGDHIIDTHDADVIQEVWDLYAKAVARFGAVSTMIERDGNIPPLTELLAELQQAKQIAATVREEQNELEAVTD